MSENKMNNIHKEITGKNNDTDEETEDPFAENGNRHNPEERTDSSRPMGSLASLSDAPPLKTGLGSLAGVPPLKGPYDRDEEDDYDDDFNSISHRSDKTKSEVSIGEEIEEELSTEEVDFNASDKCGIGYNQTDSSRPMGSLASLSDAPPLKTGLGSLAGVPPLKGPYDRDEEDDYDDDFNSISHRSDKTKSEVSIGEEIEEELSTEEVDFNASDKLDDLTLDRSISQFSEAVDYMEEVA
ncbi:UNVERIFIED_CONTAM: hypothetical protein FKN15_057383 [Acipenser sinensis]